MTAAVTLLFDGDILGPSQTPDALDMEDDDQVEVRIKTIAAAPVAALADAGASDESPIIVHVKRNKNKTTKKFKIKRSNTFSRIKDAFEKTYKLKDHHKKKLRFVYNNVEIALTDTPKSIKYVEGDIVFGLDT